MNISWNDPKYPKIVKGGRVTLQGTKKVGSKTYLVKVTYNKSILRKRYGQDLKIKEEVKGVLGRIEDQDIQRLAKSECTIKTNLQEGKDKFKVYKGGTEQDLKKMKKSNPQLFKTIEKVNVAFFAIIPPVEEEEEEDVVTISISEVEPKKPEELHDPRTCVFKKGKIDRVEDGVEGKAKKGEIQVRIFLGDLLNQDGVGAIVNPANEGLNGGGGVDRLIESQAGRSIYEECQEQLEEKDQEKGKTGEAYITGSGKLKKKKSIKHVIHAIGPKKRTKNRRQLLRDAYYNSLMRAHEHKLTSIAFPAISIGIFGYPPEEAAEVVLDTVKEFIENNLSTKLKDIRLVYFAGTEKDKKSYNACHAHLDKLSNPE